MIATRHFLSAAAIALVCGAVAGEAQAQFGMGMGMGMRGPMGMGMGMGMGMRGPMGMGSRSMYLSSPPSGYRRSYRSRDYVEDEPPPRQVKQQRAKHPAPAAKVAAPAKAPAPQIVSKPVVQTRTLPQYQPASPVQAAQPVQTYQVPQTVQAPTQPVQPASTAAPAAPASADSAMPVRLTPDSRPLNCMTKLHLKDGTILLQDFCTLEQHVIKQGDKPQSQAVTPATPPAAQPQQVRQGETPSQLARSR
jgi:hypothetical protein